METPYKIVTLDEAFEQTKDCYIVYVDTETVGLYGRIRLLQVYHESLPAVLMVEWPNALMLALKLMNRKHAWHNAHYDISVIQNDSGTEFIPNNYEDTFLLSRLVFCDKQKFSLDEVMTYTIGHDPYEAQGLDKKVLQKSDWSPRVLSRAQLLYAATDVYYMPQIYKACKPFLDEFSYKLDKLTLNYCLEFQHNGLPTDQGRIDQRLRDNIAKIEEINMPINVNSWQQVRAHLNCTESDALALATMNLQGNVDAGNVRKVRKLLKQNSFLNKYTGERIYGYFKPSARSGRLTSNDQNLQQIPRLLKGMFTTPPGRLFVHSDFAQLELRAGCAITNERRMEAILRANGDLHNYTATMFFGEEFTKVQRQIAKTCNFNLLYGGSYGMLGKILIMEADMLLPESDLKRYKHKWTNLWPSIAQWQTEAISKWRRGQLGSTPLGRRYKGKLMTDQMNIEVQGFGSEVAKLALHYMYPKIKDFGGNAKLCNFVHDDYNVEVDDDEEAYKGIAEIMATAMQEAWSEASASLPIPDLPMPVDVKVGTNWGDLEADMNVTYQMVKE